MQARQDLEGEQSIPVRHDISDNTDLFLAKIVVLGAQGVGKTSLLNRFIHNDFKQVYSSTIGANFLTKKLVIPDYPHITIRLQIWDTAGQERFRSISKLYYRGAHAALLCYDITDASSFDQMGAWLQELRQHNVNSPHPSADEDESVIHVVGTKADVVAADPSKREVAFERCISYVAEHLQGVTPTSPATNNNHPTNTNLTGTSLPTSNHYPSSAHTTSSSAGPRTPSSPLAWDPSTANRTSSARLSGFWGQDTGWDCCHEISSKDGEGVEEVFRVIARKLVEQKLRDERRRELEEFAAATGTGLLQENGGGGYFDHVYGVERRDVDRGGSFRLGHGDKRRSWLGLTSTPGPGSYAGAMSTQAEDEVQYKPSGRCC
jgi:small GTP-binding protein